MLPPLTGRQRSFLRSQAHHLEALVQVGKLGISEGIVRQLSEQLLAHELIKVRFAKEAPIEAKEAAAEIAERVGCHVIQAAGRVLTLYRRNDKKPKVGVSSKPAEKRKTDPRLSLRRAHARARARQNKDERPKRGDKPRAAGRTRPRGRS